MEGECTCHSALHTRAPAYRVPLAPERASFPLSSAGEVWCTHQDSFSMTACPISSPHHHLPIHQTKTRLYRNRRARPVLQALARHRPPTRLQRLLLPYTPLLQVLEPRIPSSHHSNPPAREPRRLLPGPCASPSTGLVLSPRRNRVHAAHIWALQAVRLPLLPFPLHPVRAARRRALRQLLAVASVSRPACKSKSERVATQTRHYIVGIQDEGRAARRRQKSADNRSTITLARRSDEITGHGRRA